MDFETWREYGEVGIAQAESVYLAKRIRLWKALRLFLR